MAPISWWISRHVNEGREAMSFSDWADYDWAAQERKLTAVCARLQRHDMPLPSYLLMHPDARLADAERESICDWTRTIVRGTE